MNNTAAEEEIDQFTSKDDVDAAETKFIPPLIITQRELYSTLDMKNEMNEKLLYDEVKVKLEEESVETTAVEATHTLQPNTVIKCENFTIKSERGMDRDSENENAKLKVEEVHLKEEHGSDSDSEAKVEDECTDNNFSGNGKRLKCSLCNFVAKYQSYLKAHERIHSGEQPFECGLCHTRYRRSTNVKLHISRVHTEKPFTCTGCNCTFDSKVLFDLHIKTHVIKLRKCTRCDFSCKEASEMERHKMTHFHGEIFKCDQCDYKAARTALNVHKKMHTGNRQEYVCNSCFYTTSRKTRYREHMKLHDNTQKRYRCDRCTYSSDDITLLITHMKSHLESKI